MNKENCALKLVDEIIYGNYTLNQDIVNTLLQQNQTDYCKVPSKVINRLKRLEYDRQILVSSFSLFHPFDSNVYRIHPSFLILSLL